MTEERKPLAFIGEQPRKAQSSEPFARRTYQGGPCPKCEGRLSLVSLSGPRLQCPGGQHKWDPEVT